MNVFFSPGAQYCSAIDAVRPDGIGLYSGKTFNELLVQYPDLQIVDEAVSIAHDRNARITQPMAITREQFDDWLNCLPPCKWKHGNGVSAFHVSERITYDIVTWVISLGGDCYAFNDTCKLTADEAIARVQAFKEAA